MTKEELKEKKLKIFELRLSGSSITTIARDCNCTRQYINKVLNSFDEIEVDDTIVLPQLPQDAAEIAWEVSTARCKDDIETISEEIWRSEADIATVVWYLTKNRKKYHKPKSESYFSAVNKWRNQTNTSIKELAEACGVQTSILQLKLSGQEQMPYWLAQRLCEVTGIEMKDLFADIIQIGYLYDGKEADLNEK